jgi:hypothetical protein
MRIRLSAAALLATLVTAPAALADTTISSNWAGYAVHRARVAFHRVQAEWRQPQVRCIPGIRTFSSYWVGLGGYNPSSSSIEQIGTEVDCARSGAEVSTAWYELLPAPSMPIDMAVAPGDEMAAVVAVSGHQVTFTLEDLTSRREFDHSFRARSIDVSSAEWIVEAPSDCLTQRTCTTLPLANFGQTGFSAARAVSGHGHRGGLTNRAWQLTRIRLDPLGRRFEASTRATAAVGGAIPGPVSASGQAFTVKYAAVGGTGAPSLGLRGAIRAAPLRDLASAPRH